MQFNIIKSYDMKKTLFIFILLLTAIGVNAQSKTRGGDNKIDASTVSQITFNGDNVTIKYNDGTSATFDMETVTIDFSKVTSIGERIEMTKKMGLEGKQVYDLKGRKAGKSAAALKKGIYVIDGKKVIIK